MTFRLDYPGTARFFRRIFLRHAWSTTQRKWTTSFILLGVVLASLCMPNFGVAVAGTAFAGWWLGVLISALVAGLIGNRVGVGREKSSIARREPTMDDPR